MKNMRVQNVTAHRIQAVRLTPVKIARNGTRWMAKNGIEEVGLMRPWERRSVAMTGLVVRIGRASARSGEG
jgi:hypothetical protein